MTNFYAHATAVLDAGCEVGEGSKIWHFCHLTAGCRIGRGCVLGQNVFVAGGVSVGDNVKIQNNVSLYDGVELEDDVFVGPSAVFTNVVNPRSAVSRKSEFKKTVVRRGASIGANATVVCGVEIGEFAFVGAGAVVTKNVAAFALVVGNPARRAGWMSKAGMKLRFDVEGKAVCPADGSVYQLENGAVSRIVNF